MVRIREENTVPVRLWQRLIRNDQFVLSFTCSRGWHCRSMCGAIGLRRAVDSVQLLLYGAPSEQVYTVALKLDWWHRLLAPTLSGLAIGVFIRFCMSERRPHGVADVI